MDTDKKLNLLEQYFVKAEKVIIAFSGGTDSTFLLKVANNILKDNIIAVTSKSYLFPKRETDEAINFCKTNNIKHIIINSDPLKIDGFKNNPVNRCYLCKKELFSEIINIAKEYNTENIIEGSNFDDINDFRPGFTAIKELGIQSPLRDLKFTKSEIRELSKKFNLSTAEKPSFACLASRFVVGEEITLNKLEMVDEAEQLLFDFGFKQFRVRIHSNMARIEVLPEEFEKILQNREVITQSFKNIGFSYTSMDLTGYRTGSMNETINR